jgi:hypothetical protein
MTPRHSGIWYILALLTLGTACGQTASTSTAAGGDAGAPSNVSPAGAGSPPVKMGGDVLGGASGASGTGGAAAMNDAGAPQAGEGGAEPTLPLDDARPECALASKIVLSPLRLVKSAGPGEEARLELEATNATGDFVSYNPVSVSCDSDAVERAADELTTFGMLAGTTQTVSVYVLFKASALPGTRVPCTVRAFVIGQTPKDCRNAQAYTHELVVQ